MRLRPRYSLLTLLLLTAVVAGGVKLWRRPHRVRVGDSPTPFEQDLVKKGQSIGLMMTGGRYEYDYVRDWQEPRILCVAWFPATPDFLITLSTPDFYPGRKDLYSEEKFRQYMFDTLAPSAKDRVHCWIKSGRDPVYREVQTQAPINFSFGSYREIVSGAELLKSYLVSEKGKIYVSVNASIYLPGHYSQTVHFNEIPLDQVIDPEMRARIAEELAKVSPKP